MKSVFFIFSMLLSLSAFAGVASKHIEIEEYPYKSSLGSDSAAFENDLAEQAAEFCNGLKNVASIKNIVLQMQAPSVSHINSAGTVGVATGKEILILVYPHMTGSADITCK